MKLAILAGNQGWHVRDLHRAGTVAGLCLHWHDLTQADFAIQTQQRLPWREHQALLLRAFPSGSLEQTLFRLSMLYQAQREGTLVINSPGSFEACVDKFSASARLARAGLPVPPTICCQTLDSALAAFDTLGGDVVIKPLFGSEGKGLVRVSCPDMAWRVCSALIQSGAVLYLQQFIHHPGYDLRAFVLGGKILAAMRREHPSDWRTNLARGAKPRAVELSDEETSLALRAATTLGAEIAGVDLLPDRAGKLYVIEVNGAPGWKGLTGATGIDVAAAVIDYTRKRALGELPPPSQPLLT